MHVDSDNGYMDEHYSNYNYDAYYLQFGSDLGMLEVMNTKNGRSRVTPAHSIEKSKVTPALSIKASIEAALRQSMRYKPTTTSNKYSALASLECEELRDDEPIDLIAGDTRDSYPVVDSCNQVLRAPAAGGPARRREPKKAAPLCEKFKGILRADACKGVAKRGLKQTWLAC